MTSLDMRNNTLFMRNEFNTVGKWQFPIIKKQEINTKNIALIACSDTRCNDNEFAFMRGYNAMFEKLSPSAIICFGKPFDEMTGNIIAVDYLSSRKVVR